MHKRPFVPITLFYISGIIFRKYCSYPSWLLYPALIFVVFLYAVIFLLILTNRPRTFQRGLFMALLEKMPLYAGMFVIGNLMYDSILYVNYIGGKNWPIWDWLREYIRQNIYYNVPTGNERNLLSGLFLGERYMIPKEILDIFQRTNTMHILAISGLHIGFIGVMLIGVLRMLYVPRKIAAILAIIGILSYVSMVGWRPPAFRAAIIFCILLMGWVLDRPFDSINSLFCAAFIILLVTPEALFEIGFQLSFIIVFSLLLVTPLITKENNYFIKILGVSLTAWFSSLGLVAYYFKIISPISVLANIAIVPAIGLVIALGFTSILLGLIYLPVSGIFNIVNYYLIKIILWVIDSLSHIPGAYFQIKGFPLYMLFIYYIVLYLVIFFLLQKSRSMIK